MKSVLLQTYLRAGVLQTALDRLPQQPVDRREADRQPKVSRQGTASRFRG